MKKTLIILITFIGITAFSSCEKISNTTWVYYDETGCADPWKQSAHDESQRIENIQNYIEDKKIKVFQIKIENDGTFEPCMACFCKSGSRIHAKIKERDVSKVKDIGFYQ